MCEFESSGKQTRWDQKTPVGGGEVRQITRPLANGKAGAEEAGGEGESQTAARPMEPQLRVREARPAGSAWGRVEASEGSSGAAVNYGHGSRHGISRAAHETWPIAVRPPLSGAFRSFQQLGPLQELGRRAAQSAWEPAQARHVKRGDGHPLTGRGQGAGRWEPPRAEVPGHGYRSRVLGVKPVRSSLRPHLSTDKPSGFGG